jgi:phosphohistidine phosphatase SixA
MKPNLKTFLFVACLAVVLTPLSAFCQVTVIFSRHAEKAATPANDPPLTAAGEKRAKILASMLADSGVAAIYTSELHRTQQTAAPLAARTHLTPVVIPANDTDALVKAIRERKSGVVVVVGHSNKLPEIIAKLGGPAVTIPETDYDNLFILSVGSSHSSLLRLHYGDSAPVPSTGAKMEPASTGTPVK